MTLTGRQPALQTSRGVIRPACCRTDEYGFPQMRISEYHIGIRFGDKNNSTGKWHVLLNGEDVTKGCVEALAGEDGWVICYDADASGNFYRCPFGPEKGSKAHPLAVKRWGRVDVVRRPD